jgi:hypothetical protein
MSKPSAAVDRYVRAPASLSCEVVNPIDGILVQGPDGKSLRYTWRAMILSVLMTDPRLVEDEALRLSHLEKAELAAIAYARAGEVVRVPARPLASLQAVLLDTTAFDMTTGGSGGMLMRGFMAQQPAVQEWIGILLDAPSKDPEAATANGASVEHRDA